MNNKILILAPISVGEYFDKLSILRIKESKIADPVANHNIKNEIEKLTSAQGTEYFKKDGCCASTVVGTSIATCLLSAIALKAARSATSVLP